MRKAQLLQPSSQNTKLIPLPAPNKGINAMDGLAQMQPDESIFQFNMIPSQYGIRVRSGYREFATGVGSDGIKTIIPFNGSTDVDDKLFAVSQDGIYDITAGGAGPWVADETFPVIGDTSGYGIWTSVVTVGGNFSLYTDELNGYYVYDEGGSWAQVAQGSGATQISGVDPEDFVFVTVFKSRVWFVERNSARAWYLPVGAIYGAATQFNFTNKFKHGGTLVGLYNWTVDGGEGIDDYLIAVSSTGDVVVYKGTDPNNADSWSQHGSWYIGPPPVGRRIGGSFGGEVYLLSRYGLLPMSKLISGSLVQNEDIYLTRKIAPLINEEMAFSIRERGWEVKLIPSEQLLLVSTPKRIGFDFKQFVQSLNTQGWSVYQDMPYFTGEDWNGTFYLGSSENIVYTHEGDLDNVNLAEDDAENIEWSVLLSFQDMGEPGMYHRSQFIRPVFLAEGAPSYIIESRYDYDLDQLFGAPSGSIPSGALWDSAIWDLSVWAGDFALIQDVRGGAGIGRAMSVGLSGNSNVRTILVRFDHMFDTGGML